MMRVPIWGRHFHPAALIGMWMLLALVLPGVSPSGLSLLTFLLLPPLLLGKQRSGLWLMLRRNRVLLLSILLLHALMTPGQVLWSFWPGLDVTLEGAVAGGLQALRLLLLLLALVWLLGNLSPPQLLTGLLRLLWPLRKLGLDCQPLALRLSLTLRYAADYRGRKLADWRDELRLQLTTDVPEKVVPVRLSDVALQRIDWLALGVVLLLLILIRMGL
ncbi:MAG: hypothetical protein EKK59_00790 [Neisseriaceae bacterium]|nr:MAG: hypothetical protein EKK59_00790 [Neisseriaceae bacterium]